MTTHETIKNNLYLRTDSVLSASEKSELDSHLLTCGECRAELNIMEEVQNKIKNQPRHIFNSDLFADSVMEKISSIEKSTPFWIGAWWKVPVLAMSSLFILMAGPRFEDALSPTRSLLLEKSSSEQAQQLLVQSQVNSDDLFTLLLEETNS